MPDPTKGIETVGGDSHFYN